jgi:hypothetical protein
VKVQDSKNVSPTGVQKNSKLLGQLNQFVNDFVKPVIGAEIESLIAETEGSELLLKSIVEELIKRPQTAEPIIKKANTGRDADERLDLESSVRFVGIQNVRAHLIAEKFSDVFESKLLARNPKTQELATPPTLILQYALKALEVFGDDSPMKDLVFTGGLIFDVLMLISSKNTDLGQKKKVDELIKECFGQGIEISKAALALGKERKQLVLGHQLVSITLINQASHIVMALLVDGYLDHLLKLRQAGAPVSVQNLATQTRFQSSHTDFSAVISWPFPDFKGIIPALLYCEAPYLLTERDELNSYDVASICFLATHVFQNKSRFKAGQIDKAKILRPELKKFELNFDIGHVFKKE